MFEYTALNGPSAWDCFGALLISSCGFAIGLWNILGHLARYTRPQLQRNIIRILGISPIYALFSWLSLVFPSQYVLFDAFRDIWEAVVIYCFLALVIDFGGGELACADAIQKDPGTLKHVFPLNLIARYDLQFLPREIPLTPQFIRMCRRCTLQFVIMKPTMGLLTIWIHLTARPLVLSVWSVIEIIVYNLSYTIALYALFLIYQATKQVPSIKQIRPLPKFLAVKIIVFATYWQSLLIIILNPHMTSQLVRRWNSFVLCIETPLAASMQLWAFPPEEFPPPPPSLPPEAEMEETPGEVEDTDTGGDKGKWPIAMYQQWDAVHDKEKRKQTIQNAKDVLGVSDVVEDAVHAFKKKYAGHARLTDV